MKQLLSVACLAGLLSIFMLSGCGGGGDNLGTATLRTVDYQGQPVAIDQAAFKDGDNDWIVIDPLSEGVFTHAVTDPAHRYGFAVVDTYGNVQIFQCTTPEAATLTTPVGDSTSTGDNIVSGTVTGIGVGQSADINLGQYDTAVTNPDTSYSIGGVENQSFSFIAALYDDGDMNYIPKKFYIRRNVNITGDTNLSVDFTTTSAPETFDVDINPSDLPYWSDADFHTVDGASVSLGESDYEAGDGSSYSYAAMPGALQPGDYYEFDSEFDDNREVYLVSRTKGDKTITIPDTDAFAVSLDGQTVSWDASNDEDVVMMYLGGTNFSASVFVSAGWLDGATSYTLPTFEEISDVWDYTLTEPISWAQVGEIISSSNVQSYVNYVADQSPAGDVLFVEVWETGGTFMVKKGETKSPLELRREKLRQ